MKALSFWKAVTLDKSNLLEEVFALLQDQGVRFCVIGGQAVNAYAEPLVSLDLDLAIAVDQTEQVRKLMEEHFQTECVSSQPERQRGGLEPPCAVPNRPALRRICRSIFDSRSYSALGKPVRMSTWVSSTSPMARRFRLIVRPTAPIYSRRWCKSAGLSDLGATSISDRHHH